MFNTVSIPSCVSLARNKLQTAASPGARDNLRLCRWVLLKNTISNALAPEPIVPSPISVPVEYENLDEEELFQFPDGDVFAESFLQEDEEAVDSEERWLDSLLEALGDQDAEMDSVTVIPVEDDDEDDEYDDLASLTAPSSEDIASSSPQSVSLPPSPPLDPLPSAPNSPVQSFYGHVHPLPHSSPFYDDDLPLLDSVDDSSDDDSESLHTPRSQRSLSSIEDSRPYRTPYIQSSGTEIPFAGDPLETFSLSIPIDAFDQEC